MKKILALVMLAGLLSANAFAQAVDQNGARLIATLGDQNSAKQYRLQCDVNGLCEWAQDTAIALPYNVITTAGQTVTLTSANSGSNIVDTGGVSATTSAIGKSSGFGNKYVLPICNSASLGLNFDVQTAVQETITITPATTADSIAFSISGTGLNAGQGIKNSTTAAAGDSTTLQCAGVGLWIIDDQKGTWAAQS